MSVAELPPISGSSSKHRPGSGKSRRSSTHSQGSRTGGSGNTGETTEIVPINGVAEIPRPSMTKRSNRSPGSTGGSSGHGYSSGTSPRISGNGSNEAVGRSRAKSSPEGNTVNNVAATKTDSKLETLFEQRTHHWPAGEERSRRINNSTVPTPSQQSRAATNGIGKKGSETFHRTKSFTNLSKVSGSSKNGTQGRNGTSQIPSKGRLTSLQRVPSEQNMGKGVGSNNIRRRNQSSNNAPSQNNAKQKTMRSSKSTPNFTSASQVAATQSQSKLTSLNGQLDPEVTSLSDQVFSDPEEEEREQRIIDWLIGVENEEAERPPTPCIVEEEPAQTDTAIHIVYDGE